MDTDTTTPATAPETAQEAPCPVFWNQHACNVTSGHKGKHKCACGSSPAADDTLVGDDLHAGTEYAEGHR